jgi:hypothetical protein
VSLRVGPDVAIPFGVLGGEPLGQVGVSGLEFVCCGVGIDLLQLEAFQNLSGILKERPHVGPHKALKPVRGDVRDAVGRSTPVARLQGASLAAVGATAVVDVLFTLIVGGGEPGTRLSAYSASDESREEILSAILTKFPGATLVS